MKRIEFIAPVEAMRGNLSGRQTLAYPLNDKGAYEAPDGKSYAKNYSNRFIGAKRASDGLKYFQVRTKSAVNMTIASRKAMAVMGGCGAIVGAILSDKESQLYRVCLQEYETEVSNGLEWKSLRHFLSTKVMKALREKSQIIWISPVATIGNPFVKGIFVPTFEVEISSSALVKFWAELANNPVIAKIEGQTILAHAGDTFGTVASSDYNVMGLKIINIQNVNCVCSEESTAESGLRLGYTLSGIPNLVADNDEVTLAQTHELTWEQYPEA